MNYEQLVRDAARQLDLLDDSGKLKYLDSFATVDLVVALEEKLNRTLPLSPLNNKSFESIESLVQLLEATFGEGKPG